MINLSRSREGMLAEIGASEVAFANRIDSPSDPAFLVLGQTCVIVSDTWSEILPRLRAPLARRFDDIPPEQFIRDIGRPLKMGLGNADKRGHLGNRDKRITVEVVVTESGALIAVSDEGRGFDVPATLRRFRGEQSYYTHKGGGFKAFERAGSLISFADGGRTLLIRFLRRSRETAPGLAVAEDFMHHVLRKLPMISKRGKVLESCRIRLLENHRPNQPEVKYVLTVRDRAPEPSETILTGRLVSEAAAPREYSVARQLYKGSFKASDDVRVPKPMAVFKLHPRLVLYRFDPAMDLHEWLRSVPGLESVTEIMSKVARGLRALHESGIPVDVDDGPTPLEPSERAALGADGLSEAVPIHGSFGCDCVRVAADRAGTDRLHIYRFDESRRGHPAIDVASFLADLSGSNDEPGAMRDLRRAAGHAFLESYLAGESPPWLDRLPVFQRNLISAQTDD